MIGVVYRAAMAEIRSCRRPACRRAAVASLSFRYATRQVWIGELTAEADPACWDLCPVHTDALTVPRGWERLDERVSAPPAPSRASGDAEPPPPPPNVAAPPPPRDITSPAPTSPDPPFGGRYAILHDDLPRVAAKVAASIPRPPVAGAAAELRSSPLPSRELAPLLTDVTERPSTLVVTAMETDGQLPLDVTGLDIVGAERTAGVVVPIRASGGRRRSQRDRVKT